MKLPDKYVCDICGKIWQPVSWWDRALEYTVKSRDGENNEFSFIHTCSTCRARIAGAAREVVKVIQEENKERLKKSLDT